MGHPRAFALANELVKIAPDRLDHVFFTNSGSESVDTALKIALAWHRARGEASRTRLIGRERGYHGVGFGGISVGGIAPNRKTWSGALLPGVDHLPHTHDPARNAFSRGAPAHGAQLAEELERLVTLHDASSIAAVIVEPIAGSAGVLIPPRGYLQRLREICDRHGILLIFDEVITGFGRTGAPFAAQEFGVTPDIITLAKGLTNGCVPMGAVLGGRRPCLARPAACHRRQELRVDPGTGAAIHPRQSRRAGLRGVYQMLRARRAGAPDGRHHRALAAADHRAVADRPDLQHAERRAARAIASGAGRGAAAPRRARVCGFAL